MPATVAAMGAGLLAAAGAAAAFVVRPPPLAPATAAAMSAAGDRRRERGDRRCEPASDRRAADGRDVAPARRARTRAGALHARRAGAERAVSR